MSRARGRGRGSQAPAPEEQSLLESMWDVPTDAPTPSLTPIQLEFIRQQVFPRQASSPRFEYQRGGGPPTPPEVRAQRAASAQRSASAVLQHHVPEPKTDEEMAALEDEIMRKIAETPTTEELHARYNERIQTAKREDALSKEYENEAAHLHLRAEMSSRLADKHRRMALEIRQEAAKLLPEDKKVQKQLQIWETLQHAHQAAANRPPLSEVPMDVEDEFLSIRANAPSTSTSSAEEFTPRRRPRERLSDLTDPSPSRGAKTPKPKVSATPSRTPTLPRLVHECNNPDCGGNLRPHSSSSVEPTSTSEEPEQEMELTQATTTPRREDLRLPLPVATMVHVTEGAMEQGLARAQRLTGEIVKGFDSKRPISATFEATPHGLQAKVPSGKLLRQIGLPAARTTQARAVFLTLLEDCYPTDPTYHFLIPADRSVLARMKEKQALSYGLWLVRLTEKIGEKHSGATIAATIADLMACSLEEVTKHLL